MPSETMTREEWLNEAVLNLNLLIADQTDLKPSKKTLVSAGWPRNDRKGKVIGQCYASRAGSGHHHIFVSPMLSTAAQVLPVLLHELIHAADDCQNSHKGDFRKAWKALGFTDKPTTSVPGPELKATLKALAEALGPYPHKRLAPTDLPTKQTTRMLKVECEGCGCVIRMTRKWLDEVGTPTCACGGDMEEAA